MPRIPSLETKIKRGYGQGAGANYKPFITVQEIGSTGTCSIIRDWITGRSVHCLSQGEAMVYYILRWDPDNVDIREQYPLWDEDFTSTTTRQIAKQLHVRHPGKTMTTDFLVTRPDGTLHAYSVKADRKLSVRTMQKLCIEMLFWRLQDVPFTLIFKEDVNQTLATNIRLAVEYYDALDVLEDDPISAIKHKIAIGECAVDLKHEVINVPMLKNLLMEGVLP